MNWKLIVFVALGATLGTVGTHSFFNGFDLALTLAVGIASLLGAVLIGYITTMGGRK
ncbi:hypothetical protein [Lacimicrobium alkaliphilum]|uniref:CTP synthetase n=1 Tax=Lacimicrobium alkaliphilum TaxID=1526571 RepID=A0ABQ1RA63_9ALTE|nr:hypothetical protein [Lacimicrobium alkaliphilum]GGD62881.1 hypothetical protein GCM10011357_17710 [Lacimicrobium alkaliphilum]